MIKEIVNKIEVIASKHLLINSFQKGEQIDTQKNEQGLTELFLEYPFNILYTNTKKEVSFAYVIWTIPSESKFDELECMNKLEKINDEVLYKLQIEKIFDIFDINSITLHEYEQNNSVAIRTELKIKELRDTNNCLSAFKL